MYNQSFIEEVKKVYAGCENIIACAERGDSFLGRYLDDSRGSISPDDVFKLTPEDLRKKAENLNARDNLYRLWSSGACYTEVSLYETMCPILFLQNSGSDCKYEMEKILCKDVGYVGFFPSCKNWNCKKNCWEKYNALNEKNKRG